MLSKLRTLEALILLMLWALALRIVPVRFLLPRSAPRHSLLLRHSRDHRHSRASGNPDPLAPSAHRPAALAVRGAIRSATARLPWKPTCLAQSLAANSMLGLRGAPRVFHIGARMEGDFQAHAWVESAGLVVAGEGDVGKYAAMLSREG